MSDEKAKLDATQTQRCRVALARLTAVLQVDITTATPSELIIMTVELGESLRHVLEVLEDVAEVPK